MKSLRTARSRAILGAAGVGFVAAILVFLSAQKVVSQGTGAITGRVSDAATGLGIAGADVWADVYDDGGGDGTQTDASGYYTITGLLAGDYRVRVSASGYAAAYYLDTTNHGEATRVSVSDGATTTAIDFSLDPGGAISGFVYAADGVTALESMAVDIENQGYGTCTASDGSFSISGLPFGSFKVWASGDRWCGGDPRYAREFWQEAATADAATPILLSSESTHASGIAFTLDVGATITGTVTEDGGGPIADLHVYAADYDTGEWMGGTNTDAAGVYAIAGLPSGDYRVQTCSGCSSLSYVNEYYDDTPMHHLASRVTVTLPETTTGIDFQLAAGGTISGRVTDNGGDPIASVQMDVWDYDTGQGWGGTRTDSNGEYIFYGLPAGDYRVRACPNCIGAAESHQNFVGEYYDDTTDYALASRVVVAVAQTTGEIDFVLAAGGAISGRVTDSGSSPIADLQVDVNDYDSGEWRGNAQTDENGDYTVTGLPSGDCRVKTCANCSGLNYVDGYYGGTTVHHLASRVAVTASQTTTGIDIQLGQGGAISGRVTDSSNDPIANLHVYVEDYYTGESRAGSNTDVSGVYTIAGLPSGDYRVRTCSDCSGLNYVNEYYDDTPMQHLASRVTVTLPETTSGIDFQLAVGGTINGRVTDSSSNPIANVQMDVWDYDTGQGWGGARTDSNGDYTVSGLPAGDYRVRACPNCIGADEPRQNFVGEYYDDTTAYSLASRVVVAVAQTTGGIDFALAPGGTISGRVTDSGSSPIANLQVDVNDYDSGEGWGSTHTDENGDYTVTGLLSGDYRVWACGNCNSLNYVGEYYDDTPWQRLASRVTVTSPQTTSGIDFQLAEGGSISGRVTDSSGDPIPNVQIDVNDFQTGDGQSGTRTDSNGDYSVNGVPAGDYRVRACPSCIGTNEPRQNYVGEYYDNVTDSSLASRVVVTASQTAAGIDFVLVAGGTITGRVTDSGGNPISGLHVQANEYDSGEGWGGVDTDSDGVFTFTGLAAGDYRVQTCSNCSGEPRPNFIDEYYDHTTEYQSASRVAVSALQTTPGIDFVLEAGGSIGGRVIDSSGNPIPYLEVHVEDYSTGEGKGGVSTDASGDYTISGLASGDYRVRTCSDCSGLNYVNKYYDDTPWHHEASRVTVTAPQITSGIDFQLEEGGSISGRVTDSSDNPLANVQIDANDYGTGQGWAGARSDANGDYTITGLPPGDYRVRACPSCIGPDEPRQNYMSEYYDGVADYSSASPVTVAASQTASGINFVLEAGGSIGGRVTDSSGNPIANLQIDVNDYDSGEWWGNAQTDGNGDYSVAGLTPGDYRVQTCTGCGAPDDPLRNYINEFFDNTPWHHLADRVTVNAPQATTGIDFQLEEGGSITGRITDSSGNPIVNLHVQVNDYDTGEGWGGVNTDSDGVYAFTGLGAGIYRVNTCADCVGPGDTSRNYIDEFHDNTTDHRLATPIIVAVAQTSSGIDFVLAAGGSIMGRVTDEGSSPIANIRVDVQDYDSGEGKGSAWTDSNGVFTVAGLEPGDYRVGTCAGCGGLNYADEFYDNVEWRNSDQAARVTLTGTEVRSGVDFSLGPGGTIQGRVTTEGGDPIANLEVQVEDFDTGDGMGGTQTDLNGEYTLMVPAGGYRVRTCSSCNGLGYADEFFDDVSTRDWDLASRVVVTASHDTSGINFALQRGGTIKGKVIRSSDGTPIADMRVDAVDYDDGQHMGSARTDRDGYYSLDVPAGSYRVQTCAGCTNLIYADEYFDDAKQWSQAKRVDVAANQEVTAVDFALDLPGFIRGQVTRSEDGAAIAFLQVDAQDYTTGEGVGGTETDQNGVYALMVPAGSYRVATCSGCSGLNYLDEFYDNSSTWDGWEQAARVDVAASSDVTDIDFVLDRGGTITGKVRDTEGNPLPEAWVNASPMNGAPWGAGMNQMDSQGVYSIIGLPPGSYRVSADARMYDSEYYNDRREWHLADDVIVVAGQTTPNVDFLLSEEQGGVVFGTVVLPNGNPARYAHVEAQSFDHPIGKGEGADRNGVFRIGGLQAGDWQLRAYPSGGSEYQDYSDSLPMMVNDILATDVITLSQPLVLTKVNLIGRAVRPDGSPVLNTGVNVFDIDYSIQKGTNTDQQGYFRFGGLPAGDYKVQLQLPWGAGASGIVVPPPQDFTIVDPDVVTNLGNVTYLRAVKHIRGAVVRAQNPGEGVPNVEVNANLRGAEAWAWTRTDSEGQFNLEVAPGKWDVNINASSEFGPVDWIYYGEPKLVQFAVDPEMAEVEESRVITFEVQTADAYITGQVVGPGGEILPTWAGWVDARNPRGQGNSTQLFAGGRFTVPVTAGTYDVWINVDESTYPQWTGRRLDPVTIESGETRDLGTIYLLEKDAAIEGQVTAADTGVGLAGVQVHAWQPDGGWTSTTSRPDGSYHLSVISGTWEIDVDVPQYLNYVSDQPPQRVLVVGTRTVDFQLPRAAGTIYGLLVDTDRRLVTDVDGWAEAWKENAPPVAGAGVNSGKFTLKVPPGTYRVAVSLPPNSDYTLQGEKVAGPFANEMHQRLVAEAQTTAEVAAVDRATFTQEVLVQAGAAQTLTFKLLPNDARISGAFYVDLEKTQPAVGLEGEVFAMGAYGGAWQAVPIDPATASFEIPVAEGTWNLGYWLDSRDYVCNPPPETRVTIRPGEVFTFNFSVVATDAIIEGTVLDPYDNPLPYAWVWADRSRIDETSARIQTGADSQVPDGHFEIWVPSGGYYDVGAHAPEEWGFIQPNSRKVLPVSGESISITLKFKESDATITGTVYYHDQAGNQVYSPAWVWAWSEDGQHTGTGVDWRGNYTLNVVKGTTWYVGAAYQAEEGSFYYETLEDYVVEMTTDHASLDLEIFLAATALPPAIEGVFEPEDGWSASLADGTQIVIPAGAMPTTDTVHISITPLVEELPNTLSARPFGFGYAFVAYEDTTGNQIVEDFNANVFITFYYSDEALDRRGVTEDDLSPAYFSTNTNSWTKVESYTPNKEANRVTVQINHFSTWALTAAYLNAGGRHKIYLPIVLRNYEPKGTISGRVTRSEDGAPIADVHVYVEDYDRGYWVDGTNTDEDGFYSFELPDGGYRVRACASCSWLLFGDEYYDDVDVWNQHLATRVEIADAEHVGGIDFALDRGGAIQGIVTSGDDGTPVAGLEIQVRHYDTDHWVSGNSSDGNGFYTIIVPTGSYRVGTCANCSGLDFADEFYDDVPGQAWDQATRVEVASGEEVNAIDFVLGRGGKITGRVTDQAGGAPIANLEVQVWDYDTDYGRGSTWTDENGYYTLTVPSGSFKVGTCAGCSGLPFGDELYDNVDRNSWDQATPVNVTAPEKVSGIDFALERYGMIKGQVTSSDDGAPIANLHVFAEDYDHGQWMAGSDSDDNGFFTLMVPDGSYRVRTCAGCSRLLFADEYYDDVDVRNGDRATRVEIVDAGEVNGVDFALDRGGAIKGQVTSADDGAPIGNMEIQAWDYETGTGMGGARTDGNGFYTLVVPSGGFKVGTCTNCSGLRFRDELYDNLDMENWDQATRVDVAASEQVGGIDFALDRAGLIKGRVTRSADGTPIVNLHVQVWDYDTGFGRGGSWTDETGSYSLAVPSGSYRVGTCAGCGGLLFKDEYYDDVDTADWDKATRVYVTAPEEVGGIDFALDQAQSVRSIFWPVDLIFMAFGLGGAGWLLRWKP